jgi:hypothetical protein
MTAKVPLLVLLSLAACARTTVVRAYPGPPLPPSQLVSLWSNDSLTMSVNDQTVVSTSDVGLRRRIELAPGRHVLRVTCRFPDLVETLPAEDNSGRSVEQNHYYSRPKTFVLVAQAGHSYVARVHFGPNQEGAPDCQVLFPDITGEPNGAKVQTF